MAETLEQKLCLTAFPINLQHEVRQGGESFQTVESADFDGDGDMDLVSASDLTDRFYWYENDGKGNLTSQTLSGKHDGARVVAVADLTGDGQPEIIAGAFLSGEILVYQGTKIGNVFAFAEYEISANAVGVRDIQIDDIDNDGDQDIVVAHERTVRWYENIASQGQIGFADGGPIMNLPHVVSASSISDINQDTFPD
ncbi:MAG: VCBS repeat-containing protein, partial [Planctomycetales bacterium]|nr:VCBS repeat-containing protein [Planctomycetales bacterium]